MQNLLHYDGTRATHRGVIRQFIGDARISWVDGGDVAQASASHWQASCREVDGRVQTMAAPGNCVVGIF